MTIETTSILIIALTATAAVIGAKSRKSGRLVISVDEESCLGCGKCVRQCHRQVLKMRLTKNGPCASVANPQLCTACGHCMKACRANALRLAEKR